MNLAPLAVQRFYSNIGLPLVGGKLFTYVAGTTTKIATYQNSTGTLNSNPIILNFRGEANIWLDPTLAYKFVLAPASDTDPPANPIWTVDNIVDPLTIGDITQAFLGPIIYPRTLAEAAALITPVNYIYPPGNIRRYGAVVNGVTDDAPAIRKALDLAAADGTVATCEPAGSIKINSTIYIPQNVSNTHRELRMRFHGCNFIGPGRGSATVGFESGTGDHSTGGATNFGQPNESAGSLHYATIWEGGFFSGFGIAFRLFNFVYGCMIRDARFENVSNPIYAFRCFASRYLNVDAQVSAIAAGTYLFQFDGLNNAIVVEGCSGQGDALTTTGIAFGFTGNGAGIIFHGNTAEGCDTGLVLGGIQGASIRGNYFEGLTTRAIDATSASNKEMDIDENWFLNTGQAINAQLWISGKWGAANHIQGSTVVINDNFSFPTVEIPATAWTSATMSSFTTTPTNYTLSNTIEVKRADFIYNSGIGFGSQFAKLNPLINISGMVGLSYVGTGGVQATGVIPFTNSTVVAGNSLQIDTKISFNQAAAAEFDVQVIDSVSTYVVSGRISYGTVLPRFDATAKTVTPSNVGGLLRITLGGFVTISSFNGSVRIV